MKKIYFNKNLKHLIKICNDSNEELAHYLGYKSLSTISNWLAKDDDSYYPRDPHIIAKICSRYRVTEDLLLYDDLTTLKFCFPTELSENEFKKYTACIFPLIKPNEKSSEYFLSAYKKHKKLFETKSVSEENVQLYCECEDLYLKDDNIESYANLLNLQIMLLTSATLGEKQIMFMKYKNKKIEKKAFYRNVLLDNAEYNNEFFCQEEAKEIDHNIMSLITEIKKHHKYYNFADYYFALRYFLNIVDNDLACVNNQAIGVELLTNLALMENVYALNFFIAQRKLIQNSHKP